MEGVTGVNVENQAEVGRVDSTQHPSPGVPVSAYSCRVTLDGQNASEATRVEVRSWLERLRALTATMTAGLVVIESVEEKRKECLYRVRMELALPTGVVVVGHDHPSNGPHEDIYVAIRNGFRAARRQLEQHLLEHPAPTGLSSAEPGAGEIPRSDGA